VGDYTLDATALVNNFKEQKQSRTQLKSTFSDDYELDYEVFVDTSKANIEKTLNQKIPMMVKSPQVRKEEQQPTSNKKSLTEERKAEKPSRDKDQPSGNDEEFSPNVIQ